MKKILLLTILIGIFRGCSDGNQASKNQHWQLASDIYIVDKEQSINSFSELTDRFKDKPFYIDRWATWCSPCLEEFKHNEILHKFLEENDIKLIYLNSDDDIEEDKWLEFITTHNLRGYHLRLNANLKKDLIDHEIFIPRLPQYMIISKEGRVIENDALRPSDKEQLYGQLKNSI